MCIPHAGGAGVEYRRWTGRIPGWQIHSVSLPGREQRFRAPFLETIEQMAEFVVDDAQLRRAPRVALYGHSMGAYVAYELAHRLERMGIRPTALVLAGQHPPRPPKKEIHHLPVADLFRELEELGGLDRALVENPELTDLVVPRIRADLRASHTYQPSSRPPLATPLLVLGGANDPEVSRADLDAWRTFSREATDVRVLPGDHFFVRERDAEVIELIRGFLVRASIEVP